MFNMPQTQDLDDRLTPSIRPVSRLIHHSPVPLLPPRNFQLHISQYIADAGHQGFQQAKACCTSTKDVVG